MKLELDEAAVEAIAGAMLRKAGEMGLAPVEAERRRPFSVAEAAEELGLSATQVSRLVSAGRIRKIGGSGRVLIPVKEVRRIQAGGSL